MTVANPYTGNGMVKHYYTQEGDAWRAMCGRLITCLCSFPGFEAPRCPECFQENEA